MDTIFALSSGQPPSAIAVIRLSGLRAHGAIAALTTRPLPQTRRAAVRLIIDPGDGELLDEAVVLLLEAGQSATGEAMAEIQCHGGRAVVAAVLAALGRVEGLRAAEPGEFTRRAFQNGQVGLHEIEALSDLLAAETEAQRRSALALYGGAFSALVEHYRQRVLSLSARVEALLDFSDEGDVDARQAEDAISSDLADLRAQIDYDLARPSAERLRDGIRVVIAGPVNSGKSTLLNRLVGRSAAIVSDIPGTTRDVIEVSVALAGTPFTFIDTAGQRSLDLADPVERIGMARADEAVAGADILLWLGEPDETPSAEALRILTQIDRSDVDRTRPHDHAVSAVTAEGIDSLVSALIARAATLLPRQGDFAITTRQREGLQLVAGALTGAVHQTDMLIVAEHLREALGALDRLNGRAATEDMLDALFGTFCIGK